MPLCKTDEKTGKVVCGSGGSAVEVFSSMMGIPQFEDLPEIDEIAEGIIGRQEDTGSKDFLFGIGQNTDIGLRKIFYSQGLSQGIPRVGGQFFNAVWLSEQPLLANNSSFLSNFVSVDLGSAVTQSGRIDMSGVEEIYDKFGRAMGKTIGPSLMRLTGDALKSGNVQGIPFADVFNNIWDKVPLQAVPVIGAIIKGFVSVIVNAVSEQGRSGPQDTIRAMPEFSADRDKSYAQDVIDQIDAAGMDLTPIWSPPGPVLDDPGSRYSWSFGFDDILLEDKSNRKWWGFGSVNEPQLVDLSKGETGYEPLGFAPYANRFKDYGFGSPIALGAIPGLSFVHSALVSDGVTGYDLGRYLPTAGNVAGNLWFQVASPAGPLIWRIWPDKLFDRWMRYLAAMRRAIHLTYLNTSPEAPRSRILSTTNKKGDKWSYHLDHRKKMVNAAAKIFGWAEWGKKDTELFEKCKGGKMPEKSLDYYIENFGILTSTPALSAVDMKINQYGAAELVTCAYAHPDLPALARNAELREKVFENKRKLLQSEKLHLVDEDMVHEPELAQAITEAKKRLAQQSMKELWIAPNPDQMLEKEVRASRMRDMLVEETPISTAITTQPTPLHGLDFKHGIRKPVGKRTKKKTSSGGGLALVGVAAAGAAVAFGKGKRK